MQRLPCTIVQVGIQELPPGDLPTHQPPRTAPSRSAAAGSQASRHTRRNRRSEKPVVISDSSEVLRPANPIASLETQPETPPEVDFTTLFLETLEVRIPRANSRRLRLLQRNFYSFSLSPLPPNNRSTPSCSKSSSLSSSSTILPRAIGASAISPVAQSLNLGSRCSHQILSTAELLMALTTRTKGGRNPTSWSNASEMASHELQVLTAQSEQNVHTVARRLEPLNLEPLNSVECQCEKRQRKVIPLSRDDAFVTGSRMLTSR